MIQLVYRWMQNLAVYMLLVTAFLQALPENSYRKYVRFFCGLLLTVLLAQPVLDLMGEAGQVTELYRTAEYEQMIKKDKWLIILLVGLLLVVIAMPVSDIKSDQTQDEQQVQKAENASEDTYTDALETRLENALAKVEGVGNVKVMITLASSSEKVVEKDREMTSEVQEGESGGKNTSSSETAVYANGNGEETPYVKQELSPRIEGVLVIADGGDNAIVIENITEAVQALFGVDTHKIKVMKHN